MDGGKLRLDKLLVERGLAPTRTRAQAQIAAAQVSVDGIVISKPGFLVSNRQIVEFHGEPPQYVSRGGIKLAAALDFWKINLAGRTCLDVGISTGGFSDCMLQRGAERVIGIDSGHGQLAASLMANPRLRLMEGVNARHLTADMLPDGIAFVAVDVSFIAASLLLPAVVRSAFAESSAVASQPREAVVLVKPQFEAGREFVGRKGVVKSKAAHRQSIERVRSAVLALGAADTGVIDSPILGGEGNREFLLYARF